MKKFFTMIIIFLMLFSVSEANVKDIKEITYNLGVDPQTLDPAINHALDGAIVDTNILEGLLRYDIEGNPEPACASSWDVSPDGLTWTFHLRENLKWSDGMPIKASHFKDGFLRLIDSKSGSPYASLAFFIKNAELFYNGKIASNDVGLSAPDDNTFIIKLENANPLMLYYMAFASFMPARMDIVNENPRTWAAKPETLISNGPFRLEGWKHGSGGEITIIKNQNYWDADNVKPDRVRLVFIGDANTALAAFKAGRVDFMTTVPSLMRPLLLKRGEAVSIPSYYIAYCDFNVTRKPFDDVRVRRALSLAIDRKIITDKIILGGHKPATGAIMNQIPGKTVSEDFRTEGGELISPRSEIEEARRLLAEAGYPDGEGFPEITLKYSSSSNRGKTFPEVLQGMWKTALGIKVNLSGEEWKVFLSTRRSGDFDVDISAWVMDFPDAAGFLECFITGDPSNDGNYSNPEFDSLMKKARIELDRAKRINYLHEAEKILIDDMPLIPLYFASDIKMQSPNVKGIYQFPTGIVIFRAAEVFF
ncbi:MAG: peptide ABC transporter substrate-binding protein [Synergistaceae bacterium]|nr:peptide ABC transporter substrate-binding protein [Synergistaceae bacterium]